MGSSASTDGSTHTNNDTDASTSKLMHTIERQKKEILKLKISLESQKLSQSSNKSLKKKDEEIANLKQIIDNLQTKLSDYKTAINVQEMGLVQPGTTNVNSSHSVQNATNFPKVGDHVVSMWGSSKWQYFTATVTGFNPQTLKFTIEWDDHDPTGLIIDYKDLALDKVPPAEQIAVGSKVLFNQGEYKSTQVQGITRSGGLRWHQGEITKVYEDGGVTKYDGRHTKGQSDGKWVTYKDYSYNFTEYNIDDFRLPPNVFDILGSSLGGTQPQTSSQPTAGAIDVFVSYAKVNSPAAVRGNEINKNDLPPSYQESVLQNMVDPREIVKKLRELGVTVFFLEDEQEGSMIKIFQAMKSAKVFIACLSDEYASNDRCRMEFQYAKKTLTIPVIPIVVGTGSFEWQMSVVGLLVAGDLYIHFKNKEVEQTKMIELVRAVKTHIPSLKTANVPHDNMGSVVLPAATNPDQNITGTALLNKKADIFFSYCWYNSFDAKKNRQIQEFTGTEWNDPRKIKSVLSDKTGHSMWIDVERLASADSLGMFGQIASALGECKLAIACISTEYANSDNCRMEIQFALSSLNKPLIAIVVGKGDEWKSTVVGMLITKHTVINMQSVSTSQELETCLGKVVDEMSNILGLGLSVKEKTVFHAPVPGDHVVSHHQLWAFFTATIVSFDQDTMMYTVDWDDGDSSGREQSYKNVALNVVPQENEVGVGSTVFFPQGSYGGTEGNNTGGRRYHQGKITKIYKDENGVTKYAGEHTKGESDGKWVTYGAYQYRFDDIPLEQIRISPNAMDALMACKKAFTIE